MWYPGHMAKTIAQLDKLRKVTDLVIEVVDARAPIATRSYNKGPVKEKRSLVILAKSDLADPLVTKQWLSWYESRQQAAFPIFKGISKKEIVKLLSRVLRTKDYFAVVIGVPNVGKSTFINTLKGQRSATVGAVPGITRGVQWFFVSDKLKVLDTPGLLLPRIWSLDLSAKLLLLGCVDKDHVGPNVIERAIDLFLKTTGASDMSSHEFVQSFAKKRGMVAKGGIFDLNRATAVLLNEIASGKWGRFSLEKPEEVME